MAFSGMKSSPVSPSSARSVPTTLAEINVTPLVDVMLVLLIIFMVSAPLMQQGIQVDLPKANTASMDENPEQIVLVINRNKQILIAEHVVESGTLFKKLEAIVAAKPKIEIIIQADQSINYGYVAQVMAEAKRAGISRVGLVTQSDDTRTKI